MFSFFVLLPIALGLISVFIFFFVGELTSACSFSLDLDFLDPLLSLDVFCPLCDDKSVQLLSERCISIGGIKPAVRSCIKVPELVGPTIELYCGSIGGYQSAYMPKEGMVGPSSSMCPSFVACLKRGMV